VCALHALGGGGEALSARAYLLEGGEGGRASPPLPGACQRMLEAHFCAHHVL
jgi:hypothetical protein